MTPLKYIDGKELKTLHTKSETSEDIVHCVRSNNNTDNLVANYKQRLCQPTNSVVLKLNNVQVKYQTPLTIHLLNDDICGNNSDCNRTTGDNVWPNQPRPVQCDQDLQKGPVQLTDWENETSLVSSPGDVGDKIAIKSYEELIRENSSSQ